MKKNRLFITGLLLALSVSTTLWAQPAEQLQEEPEKCASACNWYIEAAGGVQMLFSKDACNLSFTDRWTPSVGIAAGKWVTPAWGFRVTARGYSYNGYSTVRGIYLADPLSGINVFGTNDPVRDHTLIHPDGSYRHYLRFVHVGADFRLNLISLIRGSEELSRWDVIPSVGLGYMHLFPYKGTPANDILTANFSLAGTFRVTNYLDINLEAFSAVMPDQFDGRITGRTYENSLGVMVGVAYKFKPRGFKNRRKAVPVAPVEIIRVMRDTVVVEQEKIVEVPAPVEPAKPMTLTSITFDSDCDTPVARQEVQFVNIVRYLNENPEAKICLNGYADRLTGTDDYNQSLSQRRADGVCKQLVEKYGVDASRIQVKAYGSTDQPYEANKHNRVVVVKTIEM